MIQSTLKLIPISNQNTWKRVQPSVDSIINFQVIKGKCIKCKKSHKNFSTCDVCIRCKGLVCTGNDLCCECCEVCFMYTCKKCWVGSNCVLNIHEKCCDE